MRYVNDGLTALAEIVESGVLWADEPALTVVVPVYVLIATLSVPTFMVVDAGENDIKVMHWR